MGAPDFSRSSLTSLASIFTASVVDIVSFLLALQCSGAAYTKRAWAWSPRPVEVATHGKQP